MALALVSLFPLSPATRPQAAPSAPRLPEIPCIRFTFNNHNISNWICNAAANDLNVTFTGAGNVTFTKNNVTIKNSLQRSPQGATDLECTWNNKKSVITKCDWSINGKAITIFSISPPGANDFHFSTNGAITQVVWTTDGKATPAPPPNPVPVPMGPTGAPANDLDFLFSK